MKIITNISQLADCSIPRIGEFNTVYFSISTFEEYYELYEQIISSDLVAEKNRNAWREDYDIGSWYIQKEFISKKRDGVMYVKVHKDVFSGLLKFSLISRVYSDSIIYKFTINAYNVDLI